MPWEINAQAENPPLREKPPQARIAMQMIAQSVKQQHPGHGLPFRPEDMPVEGGPRRKTVKAPFLLHGDDCSTEWMDWT